MFGLILIRVESDWFIHCHSMLQTQVDVSKTVTLKVAKFKLKLNRLIEFVFLLRSPTSVFEPFC